MQGMDGAQLDIFDISCYSADSKNVDFFNVLLKLLLLICEQLHLCGWKFSEDQEEEVQKKLDEDCHKNLTITYGEWEDVLYLKASPKELPRILPSVEGLKARETNGSVRLEWDPLSIVSISYYIIVENDLGKAVGEPIVTSYTNCQLSSLQSHEWYEFFIWGYTDDGISKRCAGIHHFTGKIRKSRKGTSLNKRKRTGDVLETEASKVKKRKGKKGSPKEGSTVSSWLATERQKEHLVGQASNMASAIDYGRNEEKVQQVINGLQEKMEKQEEKINKLMKDNEIMKREIADLKKNGGKPSQLRRKKKDKETQTEKIATANRFTRRTSISFSDDIRNQILFSPMKTAKDVEENEKRLDDKQYWMKLVEFLPKVGGCGKEAICRIMEKLFSNDLAQQFNWKGGGKNEKKSLHKLKLMEVIYRAGIAMNINNKDCEDAARKWLKNASDREGGRKRRARAKKNL